MGSHVCTMAVPSLLLWVWIAFLQTCLSSPPAGTGLPDSCSSNICSCDTNDEGWFRAYPCNCHWYYQCNKVGNDWNPKMFDCGEWVFDPHQEACIWPELAPPEMCDLPNNCTKTECITENLDHTSAQDYSAQHTAVFESGVDVGLMAQCNNVEVAGGPKSVEITWKGSGTWTPSEVKLEVSRAYFYACTPLTGISQDQTATLTCNDMF